MNKQELLRGIPKIDEVMKQESLFNLSETRGSVVVTDAAREVIDELRKSILTLNDDEAAKFDTSRLDIPKVAEAAAARVSEDEKLNLYPLINATGTILHTNLGRAPLCSDAIKNVAIVSRGYSDLEYNVPEGRRGSRHDLVGDLVAELTGAEDAMVVNNNAAATMIVLATLGKGKEIIVSRGELIEIGGAFRIPDIMMQSGAYLQEVGTTNKTKPSDYENNIMTEEALEDLSYLDDDPRGTMRFRTGALMKVHKSNYEIVGFHEEATLEQIVEIGRKHGLPVIYDMGNGLLTDMSEFGLREPTVPQAIETGADVVLFSGDKLLGGPQAGIIVGKREYIEKMKKHPLARAMRVDKMTFAALEATLMKYRDRNVALRDVPVLRMISSDGETLMKRAEKLAEVIGKVNPDLHTEIVPVRDQIGGGSAPMVRLPGYAVAVTAKNKTAQGLERVLRKADIPVIARISDDKLLLCVRTVADGEVETAAAALARTQEA